MGWLKCSGIRISYLGCTGSNAVFGVITHAINDANKRTALNSALLFLRRNGVQVFDSPELADLTVGAATGEIAVSSVAEKLRELYGSKT
ncbi:type II toxin-antitoxin system death-on-curing family toxin [Escherichia albertii]|nr:type II toxin-antitoxin system death-on-curing family toxin [Escherichia albertii]MCU7291756.1 type II toxin-antitoxin system death-on-curing family toxin [Escherichia albertii]